MNRLWIHSFAVASLAVLAGCATTSQTPPGAAADSAQTEQAEQSPAPLPVLASAPLDRQATISRIAFGSCNDEDESQAIWSQIDALDPDLFLFIGDNVYGDLKKDDPAYADPTLPKLRASYAGLATSEPFAALRQSTPVLATWDDHDYGLNDGGAGFIHKAEAESIFETVWDIDATEERAQREGIYGSWTMGTQPGKRVQVIMLDTRFFRSDFKASDMPGTPGKERYVPDPTTAKTMLGTAQWRWLNQQLLEPADLRLIVSSIQVVADGHGWEAWRMLPAERQRLYNMFNSVGAENIVLLSGDRHSGGIYRKDLALAYPLYEITSSSLNLPAAYWRAQSGDTSVEAGPNRLGDMVHEANFGLIDVDWDNERVSFELRGEDGAVIRQETISLADLRPVY